MSLWGAESGEKPVWLTEEQKENCEATERGWVLHRKDGIDEVLVAIPNLDKRIPKKPEEGENGGEQPNIPPLPKPEEGDEGENPPLIGEGEDEIDLTSLDEPVSTVLSTRKAKKATA